MAHPLSFPIGQFDRHAARSRASLDAAMRDLVELPARMRSAVAGLTDAQLETSYRPGGWTVRQVIHHVADSHMNGYIRLKLALTETDPTIKPYDQDAWATLVDMRLRIDISLGLLDGIHARWTAVAAALSATDLSRTFIHPEIGQLTIDEHLHLYGWHSRHHVAHITTLRERERW